MHSRGKITSFLYDLLGVIIYALIIFGIAFACSSTVRNATFRTYHELTNTPGSKQKQDSVVVVKKTSSAPKIAKHTVVADTIPMTKKDNLYYIKAYVNDIPMRFIVDTGCSDMTISVVEYLFLLHNGLINETTNKECSSTLANGQSEDSITTEIASVKIGNNTINNVTCVVVNNEDAPLLLGQTILSQLGDVTIKYKENIILIQYTKNC